MTYKELLEKIENGDYDEYEDRVDVTIEISLIEYGIIRNPEDGDTLFYKDNPEPNDDDRIQLYRCDVTLDEVKEYLEDHATDGFFSFIGSNREEEINELDNDCLAHIIHSINQYDGYFNS
jgi:hypothetical protein